MWVALSLLSLSVSVSWLYLFLSLLSLSVSVSWLCLFGCLCLIFSSAGAHPLLYLSISSNTIMMLWTIGSLKAKRDLNGYSITKVGILKLFKELGCVCRLVQSNTHIHMQNACMQAYTHAYCFLFLYFIEWILQKKESWNLKFKMNICYDKVIQTFLTVTVFFLLSKPISVENSFWHS